ncbi:uncharacterized protein [Miscanthus floridulus]|uniref:uncharacterized protein isoform X3 n=1 Tax=Miscanthus floridulus TaxID=154761 RepID=UPI003458DCC7
MLCYGHIAMSAEQGGSLLPLTMVHVPMQLRFHLNSFPTLLLIHAIPEHVLSQPFQTRHCIEPRYVQQRSYLTSLYSIYIPSTVSRHNNKDHLFGQHHKLPSTFPLPFPMTNRAQLYDIVSCFCE